MLLSLAFCLATPLQAHARTAEAPRVHPRRLLVKLEPALAATPLSTLRSDLELVELWNLPQIGWRAIEVPAARREAVRAELARDARVLAVDLDVARRAAYTPNDPFYPSSWHLPQITANLAWDVEKGDASVTVGIMDTGIELTHPDLAANLWINSGEIAGNGIDDDGNGYIDDRNGYDFVNLDSNPSDDHGHGTACAGLVAAVQDNSLGVTGVAPGCRLAALKVGASSGYFYPSATIPGFVYAADNGIQVVSCSFYSDFDAAAERDAVAYCFANGTLPVVAAGNEDSVLPFFPGSYPEVLSVGATGDTLNNRVWFSNFGTWVRVASPGVGLYTTTMGAGYTSGFAGTSGACPQVAGIAALLFSAAPGATPGEVRAAIEDSATPLNQAPYGRWASYGFVNARAALDRILGITSGSVAARLDFAAPCGGEQTRVPAHGALGQNQNLELVPVQWCGVGFEAPNTLASFNTNHALRSLARDRYTLAARSQGEPGLTYSIQSNGGTFASFQWDAGPGLLYAATDACAADSTTSFATNGTWSALHRTDGAFFQCQDNGSGSIQAEFSVRKVNANDFTSATLEFRRDYDGMSGGAIETVELYDWTTLSYPYGTWVTLSSGAAPTSYQTLTVALPANPALYRDYLGTYYLRVTASNATSTGELKADMLRLRVQ
jgi:hypothetical protein